MVMVTLALGACSAGKRYRWELAPRLDRAEPSSVTSARPGPAVELPPAPPPASLAGSATDLAQDFMAYAGDRVFFDANRSDLSPQAINILDRQAEWLGRHPEVNARIEDKTDLRGSDQYNFVLGQRRAETVQEYLAGQGVAAERIATQFHGEAQSTDSGEGGDAPAGNRNASTVVINVMELR
jgi:peptidoglycan-associated lipoprotein